MRRGAALRIHRIVGVAFAKLIAGLAHRFAGAAELIGLPAGLALPLLLPLTLLLILLIQQIL